MTYLIWQRDDWGNWVAKPREFKGTSDEAKFAATSLLLRKRTTGFVIKDASNQEIVASHGDISDFSF